MTDLKPFEIETAEFAFEVYGENGNLDGTMLGKFMRCMNLNPSLARLEELGATKKPGEKSFKVEEVLPMISQLKKEVKDMGCYEDFIECLKLYDKKGDSKMLAGELTHAFLTLGEKMTDVEVDELMEDCLEEEDDEGEIDYIPFLQRMCEKAPILKKKKK
ncbi:myosin light chain alkali-like [Coccinella septempunctata]|uniref:myosin light chain alkali-like n=1 Tax=Coccinella septempunctata TaxID=41139 RepID=UPI001D06B7A7|nr:myosin light chain alkali-like [Coccinella septempunctata]